MKSLGLKNVHTEPVTVAHWIRGTAEAELVAPAPQHLALVALGPSVGTPPEGLTAEVVEVATFDELKALGDGAKGKIVLFHHVMQRSRGNFDEYGAAQAFRSRGAALAAKAGAVASLVRSAGTGAFRLPHTGGVHYEAGVNKIPAAALSAEDADLIHRLLRGGQKVRLHLTMTSHDEAPVVSANVVGDVIGRERPQEIVLLGAHLDSWDLGDGRHRRRRRLRDGDRRRAHHRRRGPAAQAHRARRPVHERGDGSRGRQGLRRSVTRASSPSMSPPSRSIRARAVRPVGAPSVARARRRCSSGWRSRSPPSAATACRTAKRRAPISRRWRGKCRWSASDRI